MRTLHQHITEKLIINKHIKLENLDELIDKNKSRLFKNISLDSDKLHINSLYYTIRYSTSAIVDIHPEYVKQCLEDNDLYDKDTDAIYLPQIDYTYIKDISNDSLEHYDKKQDPVDTKGHEAYDIFYIKTNKYFLLRTVTKPGKTILDFIIIL